MCEVKMTAEEYGLTVCPANNIAPSMLEHKQIAIKAFFAGHSSRDPEVLQLVEALKELDDTFCLDQATRKERHRSRMALIAARTLVAKYRASTGEKGDE